MDDCHRAGCFRRPYQHADSREAARAPRYGLSFSRVVVNAAAVLFAAALFTQAQAQTVPVYGSTIIRFATAAESRLRLGTRDEFVTAMGDYDRSARTGRRGTVTEAQFLTFAAGQALDWS